MEMENPFFVNPWTRRRRPQFQSPTQTSKPTIISIPVHFVESQTRSTAAATIQKAVRGFLVRKNIHKIRQIAAEAEEIAPLISTHQIQWNSKQRLRINEILMALLLRLDSVRWVRDYRKKVIRRVIEIQEAAERAVAAVWIQKFVRGFLVRKNVGMVRKIEEEAEEIARQISAEVIGRDGNERMRIGEMLMALLLRLDSVRGVRDYRKKVIQMVIQLQEAVESNATTVAAVEMPEDAESKDTGNNSCDPSLGTQEEAGDFMDEASDCDPSERSTITGIQEANEAATLREDFVVICAEDYEEEAVGEGKNLEMPTVREESVEQEREKSTEENAGMKEVMERVAAENEQLKCLLRELCARSTQQCKLMSGLVQRVDELERTVQQMERRKKRRASKSLPPSLYNCERKKQ